MTSMISTHSHAQQVASLLLAHHINDIVISPGSRSGPLVHTLSHHKKFNCRIIVDERSAAYFAIGLAQAIGRPVVLLCSSGTATLNYAPAISEAFQQGIPLIVLTADRPAYWIGQLENQCLNQNELYKNFIKYSATLPQGSTDNSLWFAGRQINEAIHNATTDKQGPVHLNIPFEEPLHQTTDSLLPNAQKISLVTTETVLCEQEKQQFLETLSTSQRILIVVGQLAPNSKFCQAVIEFAKRVRAVILAEPLANLHLNDDNDKLPIIWSVDNVCKAVLPNGKDFQPDLLITCGEQVVSKNIKNFLRTHSPSIHYHISSDNAVIDTYQSLTHLVTMPPIAFFEQLSGFSKQPQSDYLKNWQHKQYAVTKNYNNFVVNSDFSDVSVYYQIFSHIPHYSVIHLGNSSPVRYALMNTPITGVVYLGNRGVSGIDGSLSTAIGYASVSDKMNTVILGDLSFLYDSNALWNNYLGNNLCIIVINNGGGNIFGQLESLSQSDNFKEYFLTQHQITAENFAKTFGLDYLCASNSTTLINGLTALYESKQTQPILLEVFTKAETNQKTYQQLMNNLQEE